MPTWDEQDDLAFILSESDEEKKVRLETAADPDKSRLRSTADDILDAVDGAAPQKRKNKRLCPKCGGPTKLRGPNVGAGTRVRKCYPCKLEIPVGMVANRTEVRKPALVSRAGPYMGEGGPPLDPNQPVQRRIAEHIRRVKDHEP